MPNSLLPVWCWAKMWPLLSEKFKVQDYIGKFPYSFNSNVHHFNENTMLDSWKWQFDDFLWIMKRRAPVLLKARVGNKLWEWYRNKVISCIRSLKGKNIHWQVANNKDYLQQNLSRLGEGRFFLWFYTSVKNW